MLCAMLGLRAAGTSHSFPAEQPSRARSLTKSNLVARVRLKQRSGSPPHWGCASTLISLTHVDGPIVSRANRTPFTRSWGSLRSGVCDSPGTGPGWTSLISTTNSLAVRTSLCGTWTLARCCTLRIERASPTSRKMAGSFNSKRAYLGASLAERLGLRRWECETHMIAALWSAEILHSLRMQPQSFRALCPDTPEAFTDWWMGRPPPRGRTASLIILDPLASPRQRRWIGLDQAINGAKPRHRGYADAAAKLAATRGSA